MDLPLIARLGMQHLTSNLVEAVYLGSNGGVDLTRPTEVRATITRRCNYKCLHCGCWREKYGPEMSIDQWKTGLASLKEYLGRYRIQFSGGEPFVKKGFLDLLEFCRSESIDFGVITNGSAFVNHRVVSRFASTRPIKVEISVDGPTPEIHDRLRGEPGSLKAIEAGLQYLRQARGEAGASFPIRIKPTLNAVNFRVMPDLVEWAVARGATSIDIDPNREWTKESRNELWLSADEADELEPIVARLIRMKADGLPIETSNHKLLGMPDHFRRRKVAPEVGTCRIGLRVFSISPEGVVTSCITHAPLGDLSRQSAREIWTGPEGREVRRQTVACDRGCPYSCYASKPMLHTIKRGLMVFTSKANHEHAPSPAVDPAKLPA